MCVSSLADGVGHSLPGERQPIPNRTAKQLLEQMPAPAVTDMMEWGPEKDPEQHIAAVLNHELAIEHDCGGSECSRLEG